TLHTGVGRTEEIVPTDLQQELCPGLSIGPVPTMGERHVRHGTLGCIVYDNATGDPLMLTNWHVANGPGDLVVQPSPIQNPEHAPNPKSICGYVRATCVDLDCAVADIDPSRELDPGMLGLGVTPQDAQDARLGDRVVKFGAGNNRSYGIVTR